MNRFVVLVDAGYLLRQAIVILSRKSCVKRRNLEITNPTAFIDALVDKARSVLNLDGKELLRVYWYDGVMDGGLTSQQKDIIDVDDVQFRGGLVNGKNQQKGVDSLIVTDLLELATNRAICDAVLVTGDSDLAVGIELVQKRGVRVAVLGIEDMAVGVSHNQSFEITSRADRVGRMGAPDLEKSMRYVPDQVESASISSEQVPAPVPVPVRASVRLSEGVDTARIKSAVQNFIASQALPVTSHINVTTKRIESGVDRKLIHHVFVELGGMTRLEEAQKVYARKIFRGEV